MSELDRVASTGSSDASDAAPSIAAGKRTLAERRYGGGGGGAPSGGDSVASASPAPTGGDDPFGLHLTATVASPAVQLQRAADHDGGAAASGPIADSLGVAGASVHSGPATQATLGELGVRGASLGGRAFVADSDPGVLAHELGHIAAGPSEHAANAAARGESVPLHAHAHAAEPSYYGGKVEGSGVRLRSSPDKSSDENVIMKLPSGASVDVDKEEGEWAHISYQDQVGWVYKSFITAAAPAAPNPAPSGDAGGKAEEGGSKTPAAPVKAKAAPVKPAKDLDAAMISGTFLGQSLSGHPTLIYRLKVAEQALETEVGKAGADLGKELGVRPGYSVQRLGDGYHHYGMAIDINYSSNPWIGGQGGKGDAQALAMIWRACWLVGRGSAVSPKASAAYGKGKTAELWEYLHAADGALEDYLGAAANLPQIEKWIAAKNLDKDLAVPPKVDAAQLDKDRLKTADGATWQKQIEADLAARNSKASNWMMSTGKPRADLGFLDLDKRLVLALRETANLAWGAADFGEGVSGDIMHFDCRNDYAYKDVKAGVTAYKEAKAAEGK